MAIANYMTVTDDKGQQIKGDVEISGREGLIEVLERSNKVSIPVDPQTKENRGVRSHDTYKLTKVLDRSTPEFFNALANPKVWQSVQVDTYRVDKNGQEQLAYTDKLENVRVISAESVVSHVKDPNTKALPEVDKVELSYEKITRTWNNGNIQSVDDWKGGSKAA